MCIWSHSEDSAAVKSSSNPCSVILTLVVIGDFLKTSSPGALILSEEAVFKMDTICSGRC